MSLSTPSTTKSKFQLYVLQCILAYRTRLRNSNVIHVTVSVTCITLRSRIHQPSKDPTLDRVLSNDSELSDDGVLGSFLSWGQREQVSRTCYYLSAKLKGVTLQKTIPKPPTWSNSIFTASCHLRFAAPSDHITPIFMTIFCGHFLLSLPFTTSTPQLSSLHSY